jgi:hypothetical protein
VKKKRLNRHHVVTLDALLPIVEALEQQIHNHALCLTGESPNCLCTACEVRKAVIMLNVGLSKLLIENRA